MADGDKPAAEVEQRDEDVADDPAWRMTAWALPFSAGIAALLALRQAIAGSSSTVALLLSAAALLALCAGLVRDVLIRQRRQRWIRTEVLEFSLPFGLLLVLLMLLARQLYTPSIPLLLVLLPVAWQLVHTPQVERSGRLWPFALPVVDEHGAAAEEPFSGEDPVEAIVREVMDGLPEEIAARLEGWSVEVHQAAPHQAPGEIVFGTCFSDAHVIAIYRLPHLRYYGRGSRLRDAVSYTVLHEIAHALGLDETGVRRLGWLTTRPEVSRQ